MDKIQINNFFKVIMRSINTQLCLEFFLDQFDTQ